jgi:hypothetical protein
LPVEARGGAGQLDEAVAFDGGLARHRVGGLGHLLVDAAQGAPGPVGLVLVEDRLVVALVGRAGRPGLGEDVPVRDGLVGMLAAPLVDHVGNLADAHAEDERQAGFLDRALVGCRDHPGVGHDRDIAQLVGVHEGPDRRQHRDRFGLVALERLDHQREPGRVGEQPDGDLRLQPAFLGEPGLAEPVAGIGLEVQGGHVIQHQAGRPKSGVRRACRGQPSPPGLLRKHGQTPI